MSVVFDDAKCFFMRKKNVNRIGVPYKDQHRWENESGGSENIRETI